MGCWGAHNAAELTNCRVQVKIKSGALNADDPRLPVILPHFPAKICQVFGNDRVVTRRRCS
jgi:hypothetical protein